MSEQATLINLGIERLLRLDAKVDEAEGEGLRARWEFGHELLGKRVGAKLPIGLLDELVTKTGKSRAELKYRALFATKYPDEEALVNAVDQYASWHDIVNGALASTAHLSSNTDEWATPQDLFDQLDAEFGFTLDVCASAANAKCPNFYDSAGLEREWTGVCWMNPPYSAVEAWMAKAHASAKAGATVVCLVPSRTDVAWTWDWARHGEVRFLKGRLHFTDDEGNTGPAPFPSAVVVFPREPKVVWWER